MVRKVIRINMSHPKWVSNEKKYDRAVLELKKEGNSKPEEKQVKQKYVSYGGLVIGDNSTILGVPEDIKSGGIEIVKLASLVGIATRLGIDVGGMKKEEIEEKLDEFVNEGKEKNKEATPKPDSNTPPF